MFRRLVLAAACLTLMVVVVGAYVRLEGAGLGCPDWPGCYGHWVGVPDQAHEIASAEQTFPGRPVEIPKAWKEMFHRYLAGALGALIFLIMTLAWRQRPLRQSPLLPTAIVVLVGLQAALGMWTVTLLLKPVIVTLHLLGGMATLGLLAWLALRQFAPPEADPRARRLRPWAALALLIVIVQIALGGWVSANYAALVCIDFPTCHGTWTLDADFQHGFQFVRELGMTAAGTPLTVEALAAIHWTHRIGALITFVYVGAFVCMLSRTAGFRRLGAMLALILVAQIGLGIANVLLGLPLPVAVAHNGVAAALLIVLIVINFALSRSRPA